MPTPCNQESLRFRPLFRRAVRGRFDGGVITTDAGRLLRREVEKRRGISAQQAACSMDQRAGIKQRIEELKSDLAAEAFCLQEFFATEAAFLGILMLFNLLREFQRASGMTGYRQLASLRAQVFLCGAILGRAGHRPVLHLPAAWGGLAPRNALFDKLLLYAIPASRKRELQPHGAG